MFVAFGIYSDVYKYDAILQDLELEDHVAQNERSRGSGRRSLGEVAQKNVKSESLVEAYVRERVAFLESHFDVSTFPSSRCMLVNIIDCFRSLSL